MKEKSNQFTLEITTTALCNMDCTYCFEGVKVDKQRLDDKLDILKQRIAEFLDHEWFQSNYDLLNISFWGGEPTLNPELIISIIQEFQDRDNVSFHIYTNGYDRGRMDKIVDAVDISKLNVQISYDGRQINDIFRLSLAGQSTADQVMENLEYFGRKGVNISLKATIPMGGIGDLFPAWQDYKNMYDRYNAIGDNITIAYAPTIDYVNTLPPEDLGPLIETFRKGMLKIAREEIKFYGEHGHFLCTWFGGGETKTHCSSGVHMHAIDVDGNSYACHGSLYSPNKQEMKGGNITQDSFINNIIEMSTSYGVHIREMSPICKDCVATTCMVCPVVSLDNSLNEDFGGRWTDRWVGNMCGFFKTFGEIDRSVQAYIDGEI